MKNEGLKALSWRSARLRVVFSFAAIVYHLILC